MKKHKIIIKDSGNILKISKQHIMNHDLYTITNMNGLYKMNKQQINIILISLQTKF